MVDIPDFPKLIEVSFEEDPELEEEEEPELDEEEMEFTDIRKHEIQGADLEYESLDIDMTNNSFDSDEELDDPFDLDYDPFEDH